MGRYPVSIFCSRSTVDVVKEKSVEPTNPESMTAGSGGGREWYRRGGPLRPAHGDGRLVRGTLYPPTPTNLW